MDLEAAQLYHKLTASLSKLVGAAALSDCDAMLHVVEAYRALTADQNQIRRIRTTETRVSVPDQEIFMLLREMAMHTLLRLPDWTAQTLEVGKATTEKYLMHEICRISLLMYAQIWLHPITNERINMARKLVSKMRPLLVASTSRFIQGETLSARCPDFFLWSVILSLMCAYEDWDITGDAGSLKEISPFILETTVGASLDSWPEISDILENFLWARFECDLTGREAWQQACILMS